MPYISGDLAGLDAGLLADALGEEAPVSEIKWGSEPLLLAPKLVLSRHLFRGAAVGLRS